MRDSYPITDHKTDIFSIFSASVRIIRSDTLQLKEPKYCSLLRITFCMGSSQKKRQKLHTLCEVRRAGGQQILEFEPQKRSFWGLIKVKKRTFLKLKLVWNFFLELHTIFFSYRNQCILLLFSVIILSLKYSLM